jgi:hypothetical protein
MAVMFSTIVEKINDSISIGRIRNRGQNTTG